MGFEPTLEPWTTHVFLSHTYGVDKAPPAGLEPAIFGLEVRRLVH